MRILALGTPLPDSQIDNFDWGSAPSFFDYDAIIVEPSLAVSRMIENVEGSGSEHLTYSDEPIEDGPTTATSVGLADLLRQRKEEVQRLLARGGLVVCFGYPDVPHTNVSGFAGAHRYYWLPAPEGRDFGFDYVRPAHGTNINVVDYEHPFASFIDRLNSSMIYRAVFAEGPGGFGGKVIGRSLGGAAVAVDFEVGGGRVVFLPALSPRIASTDRSTAAASLATAIRNTLLLGAEDGKPSWLDNVELPEIEEAGKAVEAAEARVEQAEIALDEARNSYRSIDRYRRLLWQTGKYGFDLPVRDALALLGLTTYAKVDEPATFYYDAQTILVETESSPGAVGMEPHYRLRQRLEAKIADEGKRVPGIVILNGYRELPPEQRPQQYEDSLRVASESMRYCIVEATAIFAAVRDQLEGKGDAKEFCRRLIETEGLLVAETPVLSSSAVPSEAVPTGETAPGE